MKTAFYDLENEYRKTIGERDFLSADELIDLAITLFKEIEVEGIDYSETLNDMLLCQYGVYDWGDENDEHFSFDITRQVSKPLGDEPYQLSLRLIFEPSAFSKIKAYDNWSSQFNNADDFAVHIRSTPGYAAASKATAKSMQLTFEQC
ncbi:MAG: hypothetical protein FWH04_00675 [Oscillospiraceae bacterium]|nr:hypothetical protein [Oscillospiraceae bacterium]